jgi:outer membrane protein assembly factor BamB
MMRRACLATGGWNPSPRGGRGIVRVLCVSLIAAACGTDPAQPPGATGNRPDLLWRTNDSAYNGIESFTIPAADAERHYRVTGVDLRAFSRRTGVEEWRFRRLPSRLTARRLLVNRATVVFAGDQVVALDPSSGSQQWSYTPPHSAGNCSAWLDDRDLFVCSLEWDVVSLDPATGAPRWSVNLEPWVRGRPTLHSVVLAGDTVYASTLEEFGGTDFRRIGRVIALDRATGRFLFQFVDGDYSDFRGFNGRPTVAGRLLIYKDAPMDWLTAIDRFEPRVVWRMRPEPGWAGSPHDVTIAGGVAYIGAGDRHAYAVDVATGRVLWKSPYLQGSQSWAAPCGRFMLAWTGVTTRILDRASGAYLGDLESATESFTDQPFVDGADLFVGRAGEVRRYRCGT